MIRLRVSGFYGCSLALMAALSAPLSAQQLFIDPMFGVSVLKDVIYGVGAVGNPAFGSIDLEMDVYSPTQLPGGPAAPAVSPGLIVVHGGGFSVGDKGQSSMVELASRFTERGYVVASINYRLQGDDPTFEPGPLPNLNSLSRAVNAAINDGATAVRHLRNHAVYYQLDPTRIAMAGSSAGAVTALGVGYLELGAEAEIGAVISLWGTVDVPVLPGVQNLLEAQVDANDPGVFLTVGTADRQVQGAEMYASNVQMAAYLTSLGHPHEFFPLQGAGHGAFNRYYNDVVDGQTVYEHSVAFLYEQLQLQALSVPEPAAWLPLVMLLGGIASQRRRTAAGALPSMVND